MYKVVDNAKELKAWMSSNKDSKQENKDSENNYDNDNFFLLNIDKGETSTIEY